MNERAAAPDSSGQNSPLKGNLYPDSLKAYLTSRGLPLDRCFRCLSPDHEDKHPSMSYDARRDKVHCFACGATYDLVDLLVLSGASMSEALRAKHGAEAFSFNGQKNINYWANRGFSAETIARFGLGLDGACAVIPFGGGYNSVRLRAPAIVHCTLCIVNC